MLAIHHEPGCPARDLRLLETPSPVPGPGELVIEVAYAGVSRPDLLQRQGSYPPPAQACSRLGLEVSGHVRALGPGVDRWRLGDAVCALVPGGGYAEEVLVRADHCMPIPAGMSLEAAAALPEACLTVWANLIERGGLQPGEAVLVHGATSTIGSMAIQVARWRGASAILSTVGHADRIPAARALGADTVVVRGPEAWAQLKTACAALPHGLALILELGGGESLAQGLRLLAPDGRMALVGLMEAPTTELPLGLMLGKRLTLTASTLRARSDADKARLCRAVEDALWPALSQGRLRVAIHQVLPLADAGLAHEHLETHPPVGRILLARG